MQIWEIGIEREIQDKCLQYGLSHYLSGQASISDISCNTNIENFYVIFSGPVPPNPSELLGNDAFRLLLEYLRNEYDYVIVDTPPLEVLLMER